VTAGLANLLADLPARLGEEQVTTLLAAADLRIERIVSTGQASPPGFWYDQDEAEWVLLLAGAARLEIEGEPAPRELRPGDCLHLPAHLRHRVAWTDPGTATVWLAVFYGEARDSRR
jgi:cupin 2 domain-containing protein